MQPEFDAVRVEIVPRIARKPRDHVALLVMEIFHADGAEFLRIKLQVVVGLRRHLRDQLDFAVHLIDIAGHSLVGFASEVGDQHPVNYTVPKVAEVQVHIEGAHCEWASLNLRHHVYINSAPAADHQFLKQ